MNGGHSGGKFPGGMFLLCGVVTGAPLTEKSSL